MRAEHELKEISSRRRVISPRAACLALVEFKRGPFSTTRVRSILELWRRIQNNSASMACSPDLLMQGNYDEAERYNHEALKVAPQFVDRWASLV